MKLDYLKDGSDACPLIRLYEFQSAEIQSLRRLFESLASGAAEHLALDEVQSVDGTRLSFTRTSYDRGVVQSGPQSFDVALTLGGWQHCIGLLDPFCEPNWGYQWLCEVGRVRLLLSRDGAW